ncbi:MATE family efflux transporter [Vibrio astriarenae]|uniref:Multidrug resistance protein NorM n=1 Tax=Vibrio astriarenae TaxID=1481923 RepID=A0A7Z2YFA9_9VIBR|nr:MATE family efflux transporter [Vibrio astriarenae]QIA65221.1 MATE family efflux transporter [Vibrio astriarenae]
MKSLSLTSKSRSLISRTLKLGIPVAVQSALVSILALADVLMVSSFGEAATASVGIASKWHFVAIMVMAGLGMANGILIAQYWGKGDISRCRKITRFAITAGLVLLVPISIAIVVFAESIMQLQTPDMNVIALGKDYLLYAAPVLLLTHIIIMFESSMRSTGNAVTPLNIAAVTIGVNIFLNYCLIQGNFGFPAMGVAGAALATTIARVFQVLVFVIYLNKRNHWLKKLKFEQRDTAVERSFIKLAIPGVSNAVLWGAGTLVYQIIFGHMGTTELAVFSMFGPFESLCYSVFFGLSVACSVIIGQSLGQRDFEEAKETAKTFLKCNIAVGFAMSTLMFVFRGEVLSWLSLDTDQYLPLSAPAIVVVCWGLWLRMSNLMIINGILRAGGENAFCLRMDFIAMWVVGLPFTAIAAFILGLPFHLVYVAMLCEEIVKLSLCYYRYRQFIWVKDLTLGSDTVKA